MPWHNAWYDAFAQQTSRAQRLASAPEAWCRAWFNEAPSQVTAHRVTQARSASEGTASLAGASGLCHPVLNQPWCRGATLLARSSRTATKAVRVTQTTVSHLPAGVQRPLCCWVRRCRQGRAGRPVANFGYCRETGQVPCQAQIA
jgi:hypothetical protein